MKKFTLAAMLPLLLLAGCMKDTVRSTYKIYVPITRSLTEVRAGMRNDAPQPVGETGKLYIYGTYIFLNEVNKGIHIIDNSNPAAPRNISFINIPGNVDLAVRGNYLYADAWSDLVVFDISDPQQVKPVKFEDNVFEDRNMYYWGNRSHPDSVQVVVGYSARDTTVDMETYSNWQMRNCASCAFFDAGGGRRLALAAPSAAPTGQGGSMARFALAGNYLYTVTSSKLKSFSVSSPAAPVKTGDQAIGWNIETIFPFAEKLFIGSATGMFIYDLANPAVPALLGSFQHVRACDPVIADNEHAFVTLRTGTACVGTVNRLDVLDIKNLQQPTMIKTYDLSNPHGLSKDGDLLFICDGTAGLKLFDATNVRDLKLKSTITGIEPFDVIASGGLALVVAREGLLQYDYTDPNNIRLLSKITVGNK